MRDRGQESGSAFAYLAVSLFALFMFTGLAIDLGRGYVVKANLSKAVDAAAFAAAKHIGEGQSVARTEANKSFGVNFPAGFLGVSYVESPPRLDFSLASDGANVMTVSATAILPTTFSRIAGFNDMNVFARGQSTRRLVDLAFVVDRSGSLSSVWNQVKVAAQQFVSYFDALNDRMRSSCSAGTRW